MNNEKIEISKAELEEIAKLLDLASTFLGQGLSENRTLLEIMNLNNKFHKKEIKKKELLRYLDICSSWMHKPEKVKELKDKCYKKYNELMKKINPYFTTREESGKRLNEVFARMVKEGLISSLAGPSKNTM
jgi:Flp pilus assembly CpaF family ATPase